MEVAAKSEARLMLGQSQKVKISTRQFVCGPSPRPRPILLDLHQALTGKVFAFFSFLESVIAVFRYLIINLDLQSGASGHWSLQKSGVALESVGLGIGLALAALV